MSTLLDRAARGGEGGPVSDHRDPPPPPARQCAETIWALTRSAPVLLLVDDLHWADAASLAVLGALAQGHGPLALVGAFRPEDFDSVTAAGAVRSLVHSGEEVDLTEGVTSRRLVDEMLDRDANAFSDGFRTELARRSGGNPLFVLELIDELRRRGSIERHDGTWRTADRWSWGGTPPRTGAILAHRFDRVETEVRRAIDVACVEGVQFTADVVASVLEVPLTDVVGYLSPGASSRHRLVEAIGPGRIGDTPVMRYRFRHALFQEHAYGLLDPVERARLHGSVGAQIEARSRAGDVTWAGTVARHYELAGLPERAITALMAAADAAIRLGATVDAERSLERAIDSLETLPPGRARDAQELELQTRLGLVRSTNEGFSAESVERAYGRATELLLAGADDLTRFDVSFGLWTYTMSRGDLGNARRLADRVVDIAEASGDDGLLLQGLHTRWTEAIFRGDLATAAATARTALSMYRHGEHHPLSFRYGNHDPGVCALAMWGLARALRAEHDSAAALATESIELAAALGHPISRVQSRYLECWHHVIAGDPELALETAERALADLADTRAPLWEGIAHGVGAWALAHLGRTADAVAMADQVLDPGRYIQPDDVFRVPVVCMAVPGLLQDGQIDRADRLTERIVATVSATEHFYTAEALRSRATVLTELDRSDEAGQLLDAAFDLAREQGAHAFAIRAATSAVEMRPTDDSIGRLRDALADADARVVRPSLTRARRLVGVDA